MEERGGSEREVRKGELMVSDDGQQGQSVPSARSVFYPFSLSPSSSLSVWSVAVGAVLPLTTSITTTAAAAATFPKLLSPSHAMPHQRLCCGPPPARCVVSRLRFDISRNCIPHITLQHSSVVE